VDLDVLTDDRPHGSFPCSHRRWKRAQAQVQGAQDPGHVPRRRPHHHLGPGAVLLDGGHVLPAGRRHLRDVHPPDRVDLGQLPDGVRHQPGQHLRAVPGQQRDHRRRQHDRGAPRRGLRGVRPVPTRLQGQVPRPRLRPRRVDVPRGCARHPALPVLHRHRMVRHLPDADHPQHLVRPA
ncbi:MAG: Maltodextrin ABC transporter, permease protein MdxG, partial [uncultured Nocardioides sp.]